MHDRAARADAARRALELQVRARLERVCRHMAPDEFSVLVDRIARTQLRYAPPAGLSETDFPMPFDDESGRTSEERA